MPDKFIISKLSNGLNIAIEHMEGVKSVGAGFLVQTGARDETPDLAGVSHFLEHMCFKGTPNRSAAEINIDFDRIGGNPNAFTSHDRTFYHGLARTEDFPTQLEILADMMNSSLPPDEFDMEKNVVLEEIAMSNDRIEHVAFDLIVESVFKGNSLAWPVLGYDRTVKALTRDQMNHYFRSRYTPANMVLVVAGAVDPDEVIAQAEKCCGHWVAGEPRPERTKPVMGTGTIQKTIERFNQQVVAITFEGPGASDPMHDTAEAAASILGGGNSRFYWNIEQTGLAPYAGAYRLDFGDCGLLILMAQCDPQNTDRVVEALRKEAKSFAAGPVSDEEIQRVKNKRRTSLAVEGESPHHRLVQVMDDIDYRGRPRTVEDRIAAVNAVGQDSLRAYFDAFPVDGEGLLVSVGPLKSSAA
ncbi:MAG TPA: pitrilysin family protein [Phycisphaerae bacterium]|nr:insulinase family protein [Phycisphaerales bacterium]HNO77151.1 pitrilysin family protein [Phycisphaerae bacterium]